MLEKLKNTINNKRGLALAIRNNGKIEFYKIWTIMDRIEGTKYETCNEEDLIVHDNYTETYDKVMDLLLRSFVDMFNTVLDENKIISLLKDKSLSNLEEHSLYVGYTKFLLSEKDYSLFIY